MVTVSPDRNHLESMDSHVTSKDISPVIRSISGRAQSESKQLSKISLSSNKELPHFQPLAVSSLRNHANDIFFQLFQLKLDNRKEFISNNCLDRVLWHMTSCIFYSKLVSWNSISSLLQNCHVLEYKACLFFLITRLSS